MMHLYSFTRCEYIETGSHKPGIVHCHFLNINNSTNCKTNVSVIVVPFDKRLRTVYSRNS